MENEAIHAVPDSGSIQVRGARQNNLKGFDVDLPLGKLIVISGPSGSGKSSFAFDTIYAEGQRRYVETFSPYTRQFLERMDKPKVDEIRGIPPAIAIEQSNSVKTTRSTVGTITEINDYLKLLLPRIAKAFCPSCGSEIRPESVQSITDQILENCRATAEGEISVIVTFGVPVPTKTKPEEFFQFIQQQGFLRIWLNDRPQRIDEPVPVKRLPAIVRVIQDRVIAPAENRTRLTEAIEAALRFGKGKIAIIKTVGGDTDKEGFCLFPFSTGWHCAHCDIDITLPTTGLFSFNNPLGACPTCRGFGRSIGIDLERAIPDRSLSIAKGVVKPFKTENGRECQRDLMKYAAQREIDVNCPFEELPKSDQHFVLHGDRPTPDTPSEELWENGRWYGVQGFFDWLESKTYKMHVRVLLSRYRSYNLCASCHGGRYQPATLNFKVDGKTLPELCALSVVQLARLLAPLSSLGQDSTTTMLAGEVAARLAYMERVGLGYLSLDRPTRTLSGGEVERVNLTTCLGASLVNTLFVMDEPTVGLHPRDVGRLVGVMKDLRDKGNTLLVVEHEETVIRACDHLIELGPGRGENGGDLVFSGSLTSLLNKSVSRTLTADYLTKRKSIPIPKRRRLPLGWIKLEKASQHHLRDVDVDFPLGIFTCITGVSGSGKSTLIEEVLVAKLLEAKGLPQDEASTARGTVRNADAIDRVVMVDQSPLARTPRSTTALYLGVFDHIRELFAMLPDSLAQGLTASAFSFNSGNGRCERCSGNGFEKIEMQFLSDLYVRCPECDGKRFQPHILIIRFCGKSIHDVLEMTVTEAIGFFRSNVLVRADRLIDPLLVLEEVGLGYLRLGQPLNVLSGGESQRLKLVRHLTDTHARNTLFIFDEPTTGLHFDDVALLLNVFQRLVEQGNSLIAIEHNLEVIKCADYLIDLGPEAGEDGGRIVAVGTPEEVAAVRQSHTGVYLNVILSGVSRSETESKDLLLKNQKVGDPSTPLRFAQDDNELERVAENAPSYGRNNHAIRVFGAREHNLKNISFEIPHDQIVVITGLSGSGKSTLAFDILFAEGQRRFLDSMSPYARQFVVQMEKPDIDLITGIPPTVAIEQRITRGGGKSTVATVTEVYHFLRLLFAKLGTQFCPKCDLPVRAQTLASIVRQADELAKKSKLRVLAPLIKARKGFHGDVAKWALRHGFDTLLVDGRFVQAAEFPKLERFKEHTIDVVVGASASRQSMRDLVARALEIGNGNARLLDAKNRPTILSTAMSCPGCGQSFEELDPRLFSFNSPHGWCPDCRGFGEVWEKYKRSDDGSILEAELEEEKQHEDLDDGEAHPCQTCAGSRLNHIARSVRLHGFSIDQFANQSVRSALAATKRFRFNGTEKILAQDIVPEISQRLQFMAKVGLDYLELGRSAKTLSGGESQRIRLAAQLGSNLRGVLYVLDEPTIGLHPRDNRTLLDTLEALKAKGNSLVIVEHDEDTMRRADTIIDLGPCAGSRGGEIVGIGSLDAIEKIERSATGRYLRAPLVHPTRQNRRDLKTVSTWIEIFGAHAHNLRDVDVRFPVGRLSVISGISGSGKSTLLRGVLRGAMQEALQKVARGNRNRETCKRIDGCDAIGALYEVDQAPIGKTSRSIPATYIGIFDEVRKLFAQLPVARMRGYSASRFSFNIEGGRCETCAGQGVIKVEMNFLPTSYLPCSDCHGQRYNPATLEVLYNDRSIGQVMEMTIEEAAQFFAAHPKLKNAFSLLVETGLGYLKLGQPSPTLSGGEAQRIKLVTELARGSIRATNDRVRRQRVAKSTLYLLEEPTIGLHMADVEQLLGVLHRLVDEGHTVIVIEHNLSVIADADYVVDMGPEAGQDGGQVVVAGTPEQVAKNKTSRTAPFLREILNRR
jgi:excinuclease ABC subunit A